MFEHCVTCVWRASLLSLSLLLLLHYWLYIWRRISENYCHQCERCMSLFLLVLALLRQEKRKGWEFIWQEGNPLEILARWWMNRSLRLSAWLSFRKSNPFWGNNNNNHNTHLLAPFVANSFTLTQLSLLLFIYRIYFSYPKTQIGFFVTWWKRIVDWARTTDWFQCVCLCVRV